MLNLLPYALIIDRLHVSVSYVCSNTYLITGTLDDLIQYVHAGKLPIVTDLTTEPPGRYILNITVIDVYRFRDAFVLQYTSKFM